MPLDRLPSGRPDPQQPARSARAGARSQAKVEREHHKAVHRREAAKEGLPRHVVVAVVAGLASLPLGGAWGFLAGATCGVAGLRAYSEARTLRRPVPPPLPATAPLPVGPPLPPAHSVAAPAVRRLAIVRVELSRLLPLVSATGRSVAEQAWQAAGEADEVLRWQAARLAAVERHRDVEDLLDALQAGVASQEQLVVAVAELVAASADPLATRRLQDAADAVLGLAQGLREVR